MSVLLDSSPQLPLFLSLSSSYPRLPSLTPTLDVKTSIKILDYVPIQVATGKKTPGPVPHSAHTEAEYTGGGVEGTVVSSFTM